VVFSFHTSFICIRYSYLIPGNYQIHLWDDTEEMINLYQAIDSVKNRFGEDVLMRGAHAKKGAVLDVRAALKKG
jgi:DNA polymerase-4